MLWSPARLTGDRQRPKKRRSLFHDWCNVCRHRRPENPYGKPQRDRQQHRKRQHQRLQGPENDLPGVPVHHQPLRQRRRRQRRRQQPLPGGLRLLHRVHWPEHDRRHLQPHRLRPGLHDRRRGLLHGGRQGHGHQQLRGLHQAQAQPHGRLLEGPGGVYLRSPGQRALWLRHGVQSGL